MDEKKYFAAVTDLETTGLNANDCIPLEVGIKIIDKEGFVFGERSWLIWEPGPEWSIKMMEGAANKFVGPMHEKSGLWDDLIEERGKATHTREEADQAIVEWLDEMEVRHGSLPMMGNSIGSLDRPFCLVHFPLFNAALSYRNIDMSTIKEIVKAVNPSLYENLEPIIGNKENATHRVLGDIDACILEYRAYLENFFFTED